MPDEPPEQESPERGPQDPSGLAARQAEPLAQPEVSNDPAPVPTSTPAPARPVNAAEADVGGPATARPQKRGRAHLED